MRDTTAVHMMPWFAFTMRLATCADTYASAGRMFESWWAPGEPVVLDPLRPSQSPLRAARESAGNGERISLRKWSGGNNLLPPLECDFLVCCYPLRRRVARTWRADRAAGGGA